MNSKNDRLILRRLAGEYFNLSQQDRFRENRKLHRAVNDLEPVRPVVLIDELPWAEMRRLVRVTSVHWIPLKNPYPSDPTLRAGGCQPAHQHELFVDRYDGRHDRRVATYRAGYMLACDLF